MINKIQNSFNPGIPWLDLNGNAINAHGGGILYYQGRYYWYGEHKLPGRSEKQFADGGVHAYSSTDLYHWKDEGLVLPVSEAESDIKPGCILERPKVLWNGSTKRFVMFFKFYSRGTGYEKGYVGVATSERPEGPFRFQHKFLGTDSAHGSGDFAFYKGSDGVARHLAVRKPDKAFCAGKLKSSFLYPEESSYEVLNSIPEHTEAPALFEYGNKFYLLGSGSSGWQPNTARFFVGDSPVGPFFDLGNPCRGKNPHNGADADTTFGSQISFVLPVQEKPGHFIAMFDVWKPGMAHEGLYIWLPIFFENGRPVIEWRDRWDLGIFG